MLFVSVPVFNVHTALVLPVNETSLSSFISFLKNAQDSLDSVSVSSLTIGSLILFLMQDAVNSSKELLSLADFYVDELHTYGHVK